MKLFWTECQVPGMRIQRFIPQSFLHPHSSRRFGYRESFQSSLLGRCSLQGLWGDIRGTLRHMTHSQKKQWVEAKWEEESSAILGERTSAWGLGGWQFSREPEISSGNLWRRGMEVAPDRWYNMATCLRTNNAFFFRRGFILTSLWVLSKYWETWDSGELRSRCRCHSLNEPRSDLWKYRLEVRTAFLQCDLRSLRRSDLSKDQNYFHHNIKSQICLSFFSTLIVSWVYSCAF